MLSHSEKVLAGITAGCGVALVIMQVIIIIFGFEFAYIAKGELNKTAAGAIGAIGEVGKQLPTKQDVEKLFSDIPQANFSVPVEDLKGFILQSVNSIRFPNSTTINIPSFPSPPTVPAYVPRQNVRYTAGKCPFNGIMTQKYRTYFSQRNHSLYELNWRIPAMIHYRGQNYLLAAFRNAKGMDGSIFQMAAREDRSRIHQVCLSSLEDYSRGERTTCMEEGSWSFSYSMPNHDELYLLTVSGNFGNTEITIRHNNMTIHSESSTRTQQRSTENQVPCFGGNCYLLTISGVPSSTNVQIYKVNQSNDEVTITDLLIGAAAEECDVFKQRNGNWALYCRDNSDNPYRTVVEIDLAVGTILSVYKHCTDRTGDTPRATTGVASGCETVSAGSGGIKGNIIYHEGSDKYYIARSTSTSARVGSNIVSYQTISNSEPTGDSANLGEVANGDNTVYYQNWWTHPIKGCSEVCLVMEIVTRTSSYQFSDLAVACSSNKAANVAFGDTPSF